jgi:hypothetical protein
VGPYASGRYAAELESRQRLEGEERAALLPHAEYVAVAPASDDEPPDVFIRWSGDAIEHPYPGTAIWRGALEWYLQHPPANSVVERIAHPQISDALVRFPSLEAWLWWMDHERRPPDGRLAPTPTVWPAVPWPW